MTDARTSTDDVIARHLREHPDFFDRHPDILERLELGHESGVATSLIERQVERLRQHNDELDHQLRRLMQIAAENERLMSRLHQLTLKLVSIDSPAEFFSFLIASLRDDFHAEDVSIYLFDRQLAAAAGDDIQGLEADDPALEPFRGPLERKQTLCGCFNEPKLAFLFGDKGRWIRSAALIPLGDKGSNGLMAIGSSDAARFYPGMGTLFLDLLADVISSSLCAREPSAQRRSA